MFNIGVRAHDIGLFELKELSKKLKEYNFKSTQLVLPKSFEGFGMNCGKITPGFASRVRKELDINDIRVAVLGCYINMGHPEKKEMDKLQEWFKMHLRHVRDFGGCIVGTETGSLNADYSYHPDNFSERAFSIFIKNLEPLIEEAEKFGVFVAIEGVSYHIINTPERIKKVIDTVKSSNLKVIFDPINLITKDNYTDQRGLINKVFDLYGDRIAVIHAKDFVMKNDTKISKTLGNGIFDYNYLLKLLSKEKPNIEIIIEEETPKSLKESYNFIQNFKFV